MKDNKLIILRQNEFKANEVNKKNACIVDLGYGWYAACSCRDYSDEAKMQITLSAMAATYFKTTTFDPVEFWMLSSHSELDAAAVLSTMLYLCGNDNLDNFEEISTSINPDRVIVKLIAPDLCACGDQEEILRFINTTMLYCSGHPKHTEFKGGKITTTDERLVIAKRLIGVDAYVSSAHEHGLHALETYGLLEHGGSVHGGWLSTKGRLAAMLIKEALEDYYVLPMGVEEQFMKQSTTEQRLTLENLMMLNIGRDDSTLYKVDGGNVNLVVIPDMEEFLKIHRETYAASVGVTVDEISQDKNVEFHKLMAKFRADLVNRGWGALGVGRPLSEHNNIIVWYRPGADFAEFVSGITANLNGLVVDLYKTEAMVKLHVDTLMSVVQIGTRIASEAVSKIMSGDL
ncbi:hypothetical protein [Proteus mirabilis]|uniref:hypothetical protein n=1 Tax=Proteus mirabilis TaxID=584 RepID=UPI0034D52AAB